VIKVAIHRKIELANVRAYTDVGILWASVVLCSPLLAIAAGFAIENLFKNQ